MRKLIFFYEMSRKFSHTADNRSPRVTRTPPPSPPPISVIMRWQYLATVASRKGTCQLANATYRSSTCPGIPTFETNATNGPCRLEYFTNATNLLPPCHVNVGFPTSPIVPRFHLLHAPLSRTTSMPIFRSN